MTTGMPLADMAESLLLPGALSAIMLSIGLQLKPSAFIGMVVDRRPFLVGLAGLLILSPLAGIAIAASLSPSPEVAVGLVLLATCPVGILATVMTDLFKGSAALSIALTVVISGVYVLLAPPIAHYAVEVAFGVSRTIVVPTMELFAKVALVTIAPVSLGLLAARLAPTTSAQLAGPMKAIASAILIAVFALVVARQWSAMTETVWRIVALVILINLVNAALALAIARIARLKGPDVSAIVACHLVRQEGTAIFIAVSVLASPEMAVPLIVNTFVGLAICAALFAPLRGLQGPRLKGARP
ncbi:bile acid:sodium symporter family protein [Caulobacter sp. NIBR2454]|uniref:bile acid:sodium symporter family protein n=1 Tax=Caulobacter sp. NIBR2454 TaxID=3015996 RepID=UPI0022B73694|nr:hypothetical protein [Caulobacter sp. NIBR2454]